MESWKVVVEVGMVVVVMVVMVVVVGMVVSDLPFLISSLVCSSLNVHRSDLVS